MYVSHLQLAEVPGALELAQVASSEHVAIVDAALMDLTLRAGDRTAYSVEQINAADAALVRIGQVIDETDQLVDGYLRFRYSLPLPTVPAILAVWARSIVRYRLHKDLQGDDRSNPIVRDYRDALKFLEQVRDGSFSLGVNDPVVTPTALDARFEGDTRTFGRTELRHWR